MLDSIIQYFEKIDPILGALYATIHLVGNCSWGLLGLFL